MSKENPLVRREGQSPMPLAQSPFDLTAMQQMADKIRDLKVFMDKNLEQGVNKDWEYAHIIWKRTLKPGEEPKATLLDPGTAKIMNFMTVRPRHIIKQEIDLKTMQMRYEVKTEIVPFIPIMYQNPIENKMEQVFPVIAEGVGSSTTREKRYRVRFEFMKERDLKVEEWTDDELQKIQDESPDRVRGESPNRLFYMPTAESLGLDNTLLKMASKRSEMDAVFQLPGVAGRYSQEIDLDPDRGEGHPLPQISPKEAMKNVESAPTLEQRETAKNPKKVDSASTMTKTESMPKQESVEPKAESPNIAGFQPAAAAPQMPRDFKLDESAAWIAEQVASEFSQPLETVYAMIYQEIVKGAGLLSQEAAATLVQNQFAENSTPGEEEWNQENVVQLLGDDAGRVDITEDGHTVKPKKFLADLWSPINIKLRSKGFQWIRDAKESRWELK